MPTLFTMMMRHALYFEGARQGVTFDFRRIVRQLDAAVIRVFASTPVNNFGEMTKAEFNQFVARLRVAIADVFRKQGRTFNSLARELSDIEVSMFQRIFRKDTGERIAIDRANVWAKTRNREIGATGGTMDRTTRSFYNSTVKQIEQVVRRGYADKQDVQAVLRGIRGLKSRGYRDGKLARVQAWAESYSNTLLQHVGSNAKYETSANYYEEYDWISVLDAVTTDICISRAGNRYKYGEGPIPPAHYNCRSEIVPVNGEDAPPQRFADWLREQPGEFLSDVFKAGRTDLDNVKVITLDEFKGKLDFILVG